MGQRCCEIHEAKKEIMEKEDMGLIEKIKAVMIAMPSQYQVLDFRKLNELEDLRCWAIKQLLFIIGCLKCPYYLSLFHLKNSLQYIKTNTVVSKFSPVHFTSSRLWARMSSVGP